jgi:hypothetical protein
MRRGRHPRRAMNLKAHIPGGATLDMANVQTHTNPQLAYLPRPPVRTQRTQGSHGCARRRHRIHEGGKERIALGAIDETPLRRDRPAHQRMMIGQHPGPRRP